MDPSVRRPADRSSAPPRWRRLSVADAAAHFTQAARRAGREGVHGRDSALIWAGGRVVRRVGVAEEVGVLGRIGGRGCSTRVRSRRPLALYVWMYLMFPAAPSATTGCWGWPGRCSTRRTSSFACRAASRDWPSRAGAPAGSAIPAASSIVGSRSRYDDDPGRVDAGREVTGPAHPERDADRRLERHELLPTPVLAPHVAVVGREDHQRVVEDAAVCSSCIVASNWSSADMIARIWLWHIA